jgi:hypothetical protein
VDFPWDTGGGTHKRGRRLSTRLRQDARGHFASSKRGFPFPLVCAVLVRARQGDDDDGFLSAVRPPSSIVLCHDGQAPLVSRGCIQRGLAEVGSESRGTGTMVESEKRSRSLAFAIFGAAAVSMILWRRRLRFLKAQLRKRRRSSNLTSTRPSEGFARRLTLSYIDR